MMVLSFSFIEVLKYVEEVPMMMVMWAAFGFIFSSLLTIIPYKIVKKTGVLENVDNIMGVCWLVIVLIWLGGFISQIILLFSGVSGIKMAIIWCFMFLTFSIFGVFNYKMLLKYFNSILTSKNPFLKS